jgi:preprotein translocase subunit SecY
VLAPGFGFRMTAVVSLTAGTMFLMWLGEQITARGIGNGSSLIIFAGIVAELPSAIAGTLELGRQAKHALAVRGMGMGIGARHVMHIHGEAAVAAFQPGNPQIGGQIEQQQQHQPR